jgi:hypothetical protein
MTSLMKTIEKDMHHYILALLLAVFIILDIQIPSALNELVETVLGKVIVIGGALALLFAHPLLGALGVIAAYRLITKTEEKYTPPKQPTRISQPKKMSALNITNQFPVTVEEEVIRKMIPQAPSNLPAASFKPVLDSLHDAAKITASN